MCQLVGPVRHSLLCLLLCGAPASAEEPWPVWHVWRTGHYKLYMIQNLGDIQINLCSVTFVIHNSPPKHSSVQSRLFFFRDYFEFLLQREEFWSQHFTFLCHWLVPPAEDNQPYLTLPFNDHKITSAVWGPLGEFVIAGHENGEINQISAKVKLLRHWSCEGTALTGEAEVAEIADCCMWCVCVSLFGSLGRSWRKPRSTPGTSTTSRPQWTSPCSSAPPRTTPPRWEPTDWLTDQELIHFTVPCCQYQCQLLNFWFPHFLPAVWLLVSRSHQDLQDGETRQLGRHLSHHGSRKWTFVHRCWRQMIDSWPTLETWWTIKVTTEWRLESTCDHLWPGVHYFTTEDRGCTTADKSQRQPVLTFCSWFVPLVCYSGGNGWWTGSHGGHNHLHQDWKVWSKVRHLVYLEEVFISTIETVARIESLRITAVIT